MQKKLLKKCVQVPKNILSLGSIILLTAGLACGNLCHGNHAYAQAMPRQDDIQRQLKQLEDTLKSSQEVRKNLESQAQAIGSDVARLKKDLIAAAQDAQTQEEILTNLEGQLANLRQNKQDYWQNLNQQHQNLQQMLAALVRLSRNPPRAFFLYPGPPLEAVQSGIALKTIIPHLRLQAEKLNQELVALEKIDADIENNREILQQTNLRLNTERLRISRLINHKKLLQKSLQMQAESEQQAIAAMITQATNLQDFLKALIAKRQQEAKASSRPPTPKKRVIANPKDPPKAPDLLATTNITETQRNLKNQTLLPAGIRTFPSEGPITRPVRGKIIQNYGENLKFGQVSRGIAIKPRAEAQIVAPYDGKIVYAGPFKSQGKIIVIEHLGGYHTVIAGFARIDVALGQWLLAGEPIGIYKNDSIMASDQQIYVELRRNGQPVNPLKWIS